MNEYTTIYITRHGETELNLAKKMQGQLDSPLTPTGVQQAQELAEKLKDIPFAAIFSSDLPRAQRTAEIVKLERKLAVTTSQLIREKTYGKYEGRSYSYLENELKDMLAQYQLLSDREKMKFKFGKDLESDEEAMERVLTFLREIGVAYRGKTVLVVAHGGIMKTLLIHLGYATYATLGHGAIQNCAYIKLETDGTDFFIKETSGISIVPHNR